MRGDSKDRQFLFDTICELYDNVEIPEGVFIAPDLKTLNLIVWKDGLAFCMVMPALGQGMHRTIFDKTVKQLVDASRFVAERSLNPEVRYTLSDPSHPLSSRTDVILEQRRPHMKLEPGKSYQCRNGEVVKIDSIEVFRAWSFRGALNLSYDMDGRLTGEFDNPLDIVGPADAPEAVES